MTIYFSLFLKINGNKLKYYQIIQNSQLFNLINFYGASVDFYEDAVNYATKPHDRAIHQHACTPSNHILEKTNCGFKGLFGQIPKNENTCKYYQIGKLKIMDYLITFPFVFIFF